MNVFIILSLLVIVIGIILLVVSPSVLFKLNWEEKTGKGGSYSLGYVKPI